jgi:hypothetical protein
MSPEKESATVKVEGDKLILAGEVVESGMTPGALYIRDERGSGNYPGMLQSYGLKWTGKKVKITIEVDAEHAGSNPKMSSAS